MPAAAVPGAGTVDLNVNTARNRALFPRVDDQYNVQFGISFFDRLFIGARGTEVPPPGYEPVDSGPGDPSLARDLSPNVQLLVVEEGAVRPSVAVGAHDFAGAAPHFESRHVVVGKSFRGLARLTLGYGTGPDFLDGPFGGIEVAPLPGVSLLGEYDAEHVNLGFRAQLRSSWMRRNDLPEPALDVLWKEEGGFGVGVTLRNDLARRESAGPAPEDDGGSPSTFPYPGPLAHPDSGSTEMQVAALRQRLADLGFENVRAGLDPDGILGVEYENRRFNRNELDGLARALRASLAFAPEEADALRLTIRRLDAPILRLTAPTDALERWMEGGVENGRMLESVGVRYPGSDDGASALPGMSDEPANRSRFRSDVFIDPSFATAGFWERGVLDVRFTLNPRAQVQLLPGTLLEVGAELPVIQTEDFNVFRGSLPDPVVSPVLLHHARRLPVSVGGAPLFAQWSAGRFSRFFGGARQETALFLMDGRLRLGSEVGLLVEKAEKLRLGNDGFEHFRE